MPRRPRDDSEKAGTGSTHAFWRKRKRRRATADISRMLERGELIHNVARTFDLADIVAAHEAVEAGKAMGNIVLRIG